MAFSENLQFIRAQAGVTQEQLAERLGVSRQSVSKWESGASFPEMDTLLQICELYNANLDTLLRGDMKQSRVVDTTRYDDFMNRFSRRVSLAVGAIIAGVGLRLLLTGQDPSERTEALAAALFLLIVTVSVVVLVATGIQRENFIKRHPVIDDFYTQEERDAFGQRFVWFIAGGVGAILFGIVLMLLTRAILPETESWEHFAGGVFMLIVAGAVTSFIYGGAQREKYEIRRYNRDNDPDPEAKKKRQLISTICGVIMLAATALYLFLGFNRNAWGTAWWVFPVGGVLCGAVSVAMNPYKEEA